MPATGLDPLCALSSRSEYRLSSRRIFAQILKKAVSKMEKTKKNQLPVIIAAVVFVVLVAVGLVVWKMTAPEGTAGEKAYTFTVVDAEGNEKKYDLTTEEEMLGDALVSEGLLEGEEGQYGLYVKAVDGITANEANQEWWCLTKGGESVMTGVDMTPVEDGAAYEFTLTVGW